MSYSAPEVRSGVHANSNRDRSNDSPPPMLPRRRNLDQRRLFVGNLSYFCSKEDLQDLFGPFGAIYGIQICKSRSNDPLFYGFVHFTTIPAANAAIEGLHGKLFLGRRIKVHHDDVDDTSMTYGTRHNDKKPKDGSDIYGSSSQDAGDEPNSSQAAPAPAPPKKGTQVLINFASDQNDVMVREDILYRIFMRFGPVIDCVVKAHSSSPNFHPSGTNHNGEDSAVAVQIASAPQRGYGFVIFENASDAQNAITVLHPTVAAMKGMSNISEDRTEGETNVGIEVSSPSQNNTNGTSSNCHNDNSNSQPDSDTSPIKNNSIPANDTSATASEVIWLMDDSTSNIRICVEARLASAHPPGSHHHHHHNHHHHQNQQQQNHKRRSFPHSGAYATGVPHAQDFANPASSRSASSSPRATRFIPSQYTPHNTQNHSLSNSQNNSQSNSGQNPQALMQGYMQYVGPTLEHQMMYAVSPHTLPNSNYSSRSTSPRLSAATSSMAYNLPPQSPSPAVSTGSSNNNPMASPLTGSPRLSGMVMMMSTPPQHLLTPQQQQIYSTPDSSRSRSPRESYSAGAYHISPSHPHAQLQQSHVMYPSSTPPQYINYQTSSPYDNTQSVMNNANAAGGSSSSHNSGNSNNPGQSSNNGALVGSSNQHNNNNTNNNNMYMPSLPPPSLPAGSSGVPAGSVSYVNPATGMPISVTTAMNMQAGAHHPMPVPMNMSTLHPGMNLQSMPMHPQMNMNMPMMIPPPVAPHHLSAIPHQHHLQHPPLPPPHNVHMAVPPNSHSNSLHVSPRMSPRASPPTVPGSTYGSAGGSAGSAAPMAAAGVMNLPPILAANIPTELQGAVSLIHPHAQHHHMQPQSQSVQYHPQQQQQQQQQQQAMVQPGYYHTMHSIPPPSSVVLPPPMPMPMPMPMSMYHHHNNTSNSNHNTNSNN